MTITLRSTKGSALTHAELDANFTDLDGRTGDGDKGDVVVTGSGTTWTIDAGVVTTAKLGGDITTAGKALLDDADATAQRTTLGLNSALATGSIVDAKGDLIAGTADNTVARKAVGSDGQVLAADSTQATGLVYIDSPGRQNLLINPNWQIDQINEGALYTVNTTDVRGPDGWSGDAVGTGVFKLRTLADPDNAALKCLEITCTTADAAIAAADRYEVWTAVEGSDAAALLLGTSSAVPFLYQFKLKSNAVTGVFGVYFMNSAGNRFYAGTITIADTSEHEYTVPLTGDLTGTWLYTNGIGLRMGLVLAAGSNFQGTAGAWTASTVRTTATQANFMSVNTNIIYLKRGQLIQGALVQAYKPADIQRELAKAQRQYAKTFQQGVVPAQAVGSTADCLGAVGTVNVGLTTHWRYPVAMRAAPTITTYSPWTADANWRDKGNTVSETVSVLTVGSSGVVISASTNVNNLGGVIHATANARLS